MFFFFDFSLSLSIPFSICVYNKFYRVFIYLIWDEKRKAQLCVLAWKGNENGKQTLSVCVEIYVYVRYLSHMVWQCLRLNRLTHGRLFCMCWGYNFFLLLLFLLSLGEHRFGLEELRHILRNDREWNEKSSALIPVYLLEIYIYVCMCVCTHKNHTQRRFRRRIKRFQLKWRCVIV